MTPKNPAVCSCCGSTFAPETAEEAAIRECPACRVSKETADFDPLLTGHDSSGSTEQRTVFPSEFGVPIYAGKTVERHSDPQATVAVDQDRARQTARSVFAPLNEGARLGRFEIRAILGRGSFGMVYRGYDPVLEREVAIKVPRYVSDEDRGSKFLDEAKVPAKLRHPNIVAVFETGIDNGQPFIVAELVDGTALSVVLKGQPLSFPTAVSWICQIAEALDYAHKEGVVHRDVKPANVMITSGGRPQLMDFGLAIRVDLAGRSVGQDVIVGTPAYMAPEQARGGLKNIGPLSDQYSLGATFYEMLTGRTPYGGKLWTVIKQVIDETVEPPAISTLAPNVPADLEAACCKAMAKQPERRYADLKAFAEDLKRWQVDEPLLARPIGHLERTWRWYRRNTISAILIIIICFAIFGFAIFRGYQAEIFRGLATEARNQADAAQTARNRAIVAQKAAEEASLKATKARLETQRMLVTSYHEAGLNADKDGDQRLALLWFGTAVGASEGFPDLLNLGTRRFHSWSEQVALPVHAHRAAGGWNRKLQFHPTSPYLLVLSLNQACEVWDIAKNIQLELPLQGRIDAAEWCAEGKRLALASNNTVNVYEFPTFREVDSWESNEPVTHLSFAPKTQWLAFGGTNQLRLRDCDRKVDVANIKQLQNRLSELAWSPDGTKLAVLTEDQTARVFGIQNGDHSTDLLLPSLSAHASLFSILHFLDNDHLLIRESARTVKCWHIPKKETTWQRTGGAINSLAISKDRTRIAVGEDYDATVLRSQDGTEESRITHRNVVYNCEFSPDGELLVSGGGDQTEKVTALRAQQTIIPIIPHTRIVHRSSWSHDGSLLATVEWTDPIVRVWKNPQFTARGYSVPVNASQSFLKLDDDRLLAVATSFDGILDRNEVTVIDLATGSPKGATYSTNGRICDASFVAPNDDLLVVGTPNVTSRDLKEAFENEPGFIRLIDRNTGKQLTQELATDSVPIAVATLSENAAYALCQNGQLLLLDPRSLKTIATHQAFQGRPLVHSFMIRRRIAFSPAADRLAVWGADSSVEIRNSRDGLLLFNVTHGGHYVHDVLFSPNGQQLATCGTNGIIQQWSIIDGTPAGPSMEQSGWVLTGQYTADGEHFVAASTDRHARVWDVRRGAVVAATREHEHEVYSIAITPSQTAFITGSKNGSILVWDIENGGQIGSSLKLPNQVYQMVISEEHSQLVATGNFRSIMARPFSEWHRTADDQLEPQVMKTLSELAAAQSVKSGGIPVSITGDEWLDLWATISNRIPSK